MKNRSNTSSDTENTRHVSSIGLRVVSTCIACFAVSVCIAEPVTYRFDFTWDRKSKSSQQFDFGHEGTVWITVDNGADTFTNQTYLNSQITAVRVESGSQSNYWTAEDMTSSEEGAMIENALERSYISTDSWGFSTLDLVSTRNSEVEFNNAKGSVAFFECIPWLEIGCTAVLRFGAVDSKSDAKGFVWFELPGDGIIGEVEATQ